MGSSAELEVPARWLHCPRKATNLLVQKFLAFKTPLSTKYDNLVPPGNRFPPKMLFNNIKDYKIKLGLWIDLTNTNRFYDRKEIEDHECKYIKIKCRGHGETPDLDQTKAFLDTVALFIQKNPLHAIGVHCTHGFNRTGFLLISYLVEKMDWGVGAAIKEFANLRPPGIYKADYIQELYNRYDDDIYDVLDLPTLPSWHTESDDAAIGENKEVSFLPEVSTIPQFSQQPTLKELQKLIQKMCGWQSNGFPGSQPVSMDMKNIGLLAKKAYRVSWKADGSRYLMLIYKENNVFLFDRDFRAYIIKNIRFPFKEDISIHLENTLLDGEMVVDVANGVKIPRFLVYDIICFNGMDVKNSPFYPNRLRCIESEIIAPRHRAIMKGKLNREREPFGVRLKEFWDISQSGSLLSEKFTKSLLHKPDGLIFQPSKEPYVPGTCKDVLKWKPANLNSIDFRLKIVKEKKEGCLPTTVGNLYVGQLDVPYGKIDNYKTVKDLDNKIIECKLHNNKWVFMRERSDKSFPNSLNTAESVLNSISNPVTQEHLMSFISGKRFHDDGDRMPPPQPKKMRHS